MTTASANYVISAQDATKDAIRQIQNNFKSLDSGIKSTARGINLTLGVIAGTGLKNLFRSSLEATRQSAGANSEFAKALDDVKAAATNLLVPKSGLPGVTDAMKELATTLKDPALVSAADALFSSLARGASFAAKELVNYINLLKDGAKGWQIMLTGKGGNDQVDIDNQILKLQERLRRIDSNPRNAGSKGRASVQGQIDQLQRNWDLAGAMLLPSFTPQLPSSAGKFTTQEDAEAASNLLKDTQEMSERLFKQTNEFFDDQLRETLSNQQEAHDAQVKLTQDAQESARESARRMADTQEEQQNTQLIYAQEGMAGIHDALKTFFLSPAKDGIEGLGRSVIQTFEGILANIAATKLASKLFGDLDKFGSLSGGIFSKGLNSLFGGFKAEGGPLTPGKWHIAGEHGPEPIWGGGPGAFATGYGRGGSVVAPVFHIDARGAQQGVAEQITAAIRAAAPMIVDASRAAVRNDISRRAYG